MYCKDWKREKGIIEFNVCTLEMHMHHGDLVSHGKAEKNKYYQMCEFLGGIVSGFFFFLRF